MRLLSSRSTEAALALALGLWAGRADAQACCAGGSAYQPARLKLHEDLLFGVAVRASDQLGTAFPDGSYQRTPGGSGEQDFEEDLLATVRLLGRGQLGLTVPLIQTNRYVPGVSDLGAGFGDLALSVRWDFLLANESSHLPGFALLGGFTFPTGVAPEASTSALGASATGQGAFQGSFGLALERTFYDRIVVNLTGVATQAFPRSVQGTTEILGTQLSGLAAAGWIFSNDAALAATLTTSASLDSRIDGQLDPRSERVVTTLGLAGGLPLTEEWRLQATAFWDLPVLGRNHIDGIGGSFTVIRAFYFL